MDKSIYITVDALSDFTHGFFSRHGGVSKGIFESMDCQLAEPRTLHPDAYQNFLLAQKHLGAPNTELHTLHLVHGNTVHEPQYQNVLFPSADASVSSDPRIMLSITTADCVPVLLGDPETRTVAAIHAGWRGGLCNIIAKTVDVIMRQGTPPKRIRAGIGPCISQNHLTLNPSIKSEFINANPQYKQFFHDENLDLGSLIHAQLTECGLEHVERVPINTYTNTNFFSARRARHKCENAFAAQPSLITAMEAQ